jgi:hypothetical protein
MENLRNSRHLLHSPRPTVVLSPLETVSSASEPGMSDPLGPEIIAKVTHEAQHSQQSAVLEDTRCGRFETPSFGFEPVHFSHHSAPAMRGRSAQLPARTTNASPQPIWHSRCTLSSTSISSIVARPSPIELGWASLDR